MYYYIFYISYLHHKRITELTGIESYVRDCLDKSDYSWFPMHRSKGLDHGEVVNIDKVQTNQVN